MSWQIDPDRLWLRIDRQRIRLSSIISYKDCTYEPLTYQVSIQTESLIIYQFSSQAQVDKFIAALDQVFQLNFDHSLIRGFTTAGEELLP